MPLEGHDISWGELPFWAICGVCHVLYCVPIWRVWLRAIHPPMDLILHEALSFYSPRSIARLTFVEESLCGDHKAMRWEQGVCFAIFHIFMCPLGE